MWYVYFSRVHPSLCWLALRHELQILYSGPGASQVEKMRCVAAGVNADECNVQEQGEGELNQVQADALLLFLSEIHTAYFTFTTTTQAAYPS